jgi:hypothetical protein
MALPSRLALLAPLVAVTLLPGCSSGSPTIPEGILRSAIALSVTPSPLVPITAIPPLYSLRYTVKISEVAGLGGELQYVNGTVFDDVSGLTVGFNNYDSADLLVFVGAKRIDAGESRDVQQEISYQLPASSTKAILTINIQFKDDRGNFISQSILVRVAE